MEQKEKLVEFEKWCPVCAFKDEPEENEPCCDCLEEPVNMNSHKPVMFKEKR